ncbi:hypothetical protein [Vagococcus sp. WN89Y]|uniref:hypothetical protein n=1 Tax=Vagococcus sp. WN89Y TaxID=3457258 RepID=UPI003FCC7143
MNDALALRWVCWWQYDFWMQADESWRTQPLARLPAAVQLDYLRQHASVWQRTLGLAPEVLPEPQPLVLAISELNAAQRAQLLGLVTEICAGTTALSAELKIWLRRLARGMRTECWVPGDLFADGGGGGSLRLLQALFPAVWPRLRLLFPAEDAPSCPPLLLPAHRLRPLWEAALWQVQQHAGETRDVDT